MRRRFINTVRRATSVGWAVNTGVTETWESATSVCSALSPADFLSSFQKRVDLGIRTRGSGCGLEQLNGRLRLLISQQFLCFRDRGPNCGGSVR